MWAPVVFQCFILFLLLLQKIIKGLLKDNYVAQNGRHYSVPDVKRSSLLCMLSSPI